MTGLIRKHQKLIWSIVIAVTIVTFVGFLSPSSKMHSDDRRSLDLGTISGEPISARQFQDARTEEQIGFLLNYGEWPTQVDRLRQMGWDLEARTYQRLLLTSKIEKMKIEVSDDAVVNLIRQILGQDQAKEKYQVFIKERLNANGASEDDFQRYIRHYIGQQQLIATFGMTGSLITEKEAESFYRRENEPISTEMVNFPASNYVSKVTVTPQALNEYYTNNQAAYRIPEKVQVEYVKFETTNFLPEVDKRLSQETNLTAQIDQIYMRQGAEAFKDKAGKQMTEADAKALIRKEMRDTSALALARGKANEFLNDLYNQCSETNAFTLAKFEALAKSKGLTTKVTEPFDAQTGPAMKVTRDFTQLAFRLRVDPTDKSNVSLFSTKAISGEDGVYAIALKDRVPGRIQPLTAIRDAVTADYKKSQAMQLATEAGEKFDAAVTNGLAAGKSFDQICAQAGVKATTMAPFSLSTKVYPDLDKNEFEEVQRIASMTPTDKSSPFMPGMEGGFVLYIKARLPVDEAKMKTEMPAYLTQMRSKRQIAAFNEWFQKQLEEIRRPVTKSQG